MRERSPTRVRSPCTLYNYVEVELRLLNQMGSVAFAETTPQDDPTEAIGKEIANTMAEIDALIRKRAWIEKLLQRVAEDRADNDFRPEDRKQGREKLDTDQDIETRRAVLAKLEKKREQIKVTPPPTEQLENVKRLKSR